MGPQVTVVRTRTCRTFACSPRTTAVDLLGVTSPRPLEAREWNSAHVP